MYVCMYYSCTTIIKLCVCTCVCLATDCVFREGKNDAANVSGAQLQQSGMCCVCVCVCVCIQ